MSNDLGKSSTPTGLGVFSSQAAIPRDVLSTRHRCSAGTCPGQGYFHDLSTGQTNFLSLLWREVIDSIKYSESRDQKFSQWCQATPQLLLCRLPLGPVWVLNSANRNFILAGGWNLSQRRSAIQLIQTKGIL